MAGPFPWLEAEVVTMAWCWKITLIDTTIYGFTSHDKNLVIGGVTYEASSGFIPTSVDTTNNMAVDNLDVEGILSSDRISADDLAAGRYDGAKIEVFVCNWADLTDPMLTLRKGTLGQVSYGKRSYEAEIRGLLQPYQQAAGEVFGKTCRAVLGDAKCTKSLTSFTHYGVVTVMNDNDTFQTNLTQANEYFDYGLITFNSGDNSGYSYEIKSYLNANGEVNLFLPTLFPVGVGDTFTAVVGCDGNWSTCGTKFNNRLNFRGEPFIPGNDYVASYPSKESTNTVSEGQDATRS